MGCITSCKRIDGRVYSSASSGFSAVNRFVLSSACKSAVNFCNKAPKVTQRHGDYVGTNILKSTVESQVGDCRGLC